VAACYPCTDVHTFLIIFIFNKNIKLLLKELDYHKKKKNMIKKLMKSSLAKFPFRDNLFVLHLKKIKRINNSCMKFFFQGKLGYFTVQKFKTPIYPVLFSNTN